MDSSGIFGIFKNLSRVILAPNKLPSLSKICYHKSRKIFKCVILRIMELKKFFAERLKEVRQKRGYTQSRLYEISGVHNKVIAKYESGNFLPNADNLKKLAEALEVSADYFLFESADEGGIPIIKNPELYKKYFILETLPDQELQGIITLLDSLIARKKFKDLSLEYVK